MSQSQSQHLLILISSSSKWNAEQEETSELQLSRPALVGKQAKSTKSTKRLFFFKPSPPRFVLPKTQSIQYTMSLQTGRGSGQLCEDRPNNLSSRHPPLLTDLFRWASLVGQCASYYNTSHLSNGNNTAIPLELVLNRNWHLRRVQLASSQPRDISRVWWVF